MKWTGDVGILTSLGALNGSRKTCGLACIGSAPRVTVSLGIMICGFAFCLVYLCIFNGIANAAEPPDLVRLRDTICHRIESSAEVAHPEWMKGDGNKGNPQSWGLCQIQYRTAVGIGGLGWLERVGGFPAVFIVLGHADRAKEVALTILQWCAAVKQRRTIIGLSACYNSPGMSYPAPGSGPLRDYAEKVAAAYKETGK